jgi:hypothetical protein
MPSAGLISTPVGGRWPPRSTARACTLSQVPRAMLPPARPRLGLTRQPWWLPMACPRPGLTRRPWCLPPVRPRPWLTRRPWVLPPARPWPGLTQRLWCLPPAHPRPGLMRWPRSYLAVVAPAPDAIGASVTNDVPASKPTVPVDN